MRQHNKSPEQKKLPSEPARIVPSFHSLTTILGIYYKYHHRRVVEATSTHTLEYTEDLVGTRCMYTCVGFSFIVDVLLLAGN